MFRVLVALAVVAISFKSTAQQWKPAGNRIRTQWAQQVDPVKPLPEYPRPQFVRTNNWINLNGIWSYTITPVTAASMGANEGSILVPFAIESSLSGVGRTVGKDSLLWYSKTISIPKQFRGKRLLLHFGAVDWRCDVYVNGISAGMHEGGYDPFSIDVTDQVAGKNNASLVLKVWDPTDGGPQPRGKQVKSPEGIFYTAVTGVWQTVWLEAVSNSYINNVDIVPDIDRAILSIDANVQQAQPGDIIKIVASDSTKIIAELSVNGDFKGEVSVPSPRLWSPEDPFLYKISYTLVRKGKPVDQVSSYFAMRKIALASDKDNYQRIMLNNKPFFSYGPLDQGWWPDGLYTAPTDEALKFDVEQTRAMGFNMIRKHVKVEPARWYHYCDVIGILVWQDMPSGENLDGNRWESRPFVVGLGTDIQRTAASEKIYRTEWERIMQALHNVPSIVVWIPFNEGWGQFKTSEIAEWTMKKDPSRLVNAASGGNFTMAGHIIDLHNYPEPAMPDPRVFGQHHAIVLGEFGGLGLPVQNHLWQEKNWGYQSFGTADSLLRRYSGFIDRIASYIPLGLTAAIYTQTTDVEGEINGVMTYDRKVIKMPADKLKAIHQKLYGR